MITKHVADEHCPFSSPKATPKSMTSDDHANHTCDLPVISRRIVRGQKNAKPGNTTTVVKDDIPLVSEGNSVFNDGKEMTAATAKAAAVVKDDFPLVSEGNSVFNDGREIGMQGADLNAGRGTGKSNLKARLFPSVVAESAGVAQVRVCSDAFSKAAMHRSDPTDLRSKSIEQESRENGSRVGCSVEPEHLQILQVVRRLKELVQQLHAGRISPQGFAMLKQEILEKVKASQSVSNDGRRKQGSSHVARSSRNRSVHPVTNRSSGQLWDDSSFSQTLLAAAAKLSALSSRDLPAKRVKIPPQSESGRMAKWNALCIAQVQMTSGQGTTSGTHSTRSPPRQAVTDITSLQAAQTTRMPPSETKRMPQSSTCDKETPNILLGPLDFIATSLTAVSHWNVDILALPASSVTKVLIPA